MSTPRYIFVSHVRPGLAALAQTSHNGRTAVELRVDLEGEQPGAQPRRRTINRRLELYGPGDVGGFDHGQVARVYPRPGTPNAEPNYFAAIDLDRPDLAWLATAEAPNAGRLRPWLALVVAEQREGVRLVVEDGLEVPVLELSKDPERALWPLDEAWAWAHAQVLDEGGLPGTVQSVIANDINCVSRLLCPRRLDPNRSYVAAVVPSYLAGVQAAFGDEVTASDEPAWDRARLDAVVRLPVLYHWQFSTGPAGDFESLAAKLHAVADPPGVGQASLDVDDPSLDGAQAGPLDMQGALRLAGRGPVDDPTPAGVVDALSDYLADNPGSGPAEGEARIVAPLPLYGGRSVGARSPAAGPSWLGELNLDPRHRLAAGIGARIVQADQTQLMASAWDQLGTLARADRLARQRELAMASRERLFGKHLPNMDIDRMISATRPAHYALGGADSSLGTKLARQPALEAAASASLARRVGVRRVLRREGAASETRGKAGLLSRIHDHTLTVVPDPEDGSYPRPNVNEHSPGLHQAAVELRAALHPRSNPRHRGPALGLGARQILRDDPRVEAGAGGEPVSFEPRMDHPMVHELARRRPELVLPGVEAVPDNSVILLEPNAAFIEAFMVGLNHELNRELLWRGFPASGRGTSFRRFWDRIGEDADDIEAIRGWQGALGDHLLTSNDGQDSLLLVRGELLLRYPNTVIYATRSTRRGTEVREPYIRGELPPDMVYIGFDISPRDLRDQDWTFVFEEQVSELRFGLDVDPEPGPNPGADDLSWPEGAAFASATDPELQSQHGHWGRDAAAIAKLSYQRPVRVRFDAKTLLPLPKT